MRRVRGREAGSTNTKLSKPGEKTRKEVSDRKNGGEYLEIRVRGRARTARQADPLGFSLG